MGRWLCVLGLASLGGCVVYERAPASRPADPPLSRDEASRLLAAGVSGPVLDELVERRGVEPLDADALAALKKAGASDALLQKMIASVRTPPPEPETVVVDYPHYYYPYYYGYGWPYWRSYYPGWSFGFGYSRSYYRGSSRGIRVYR